MKVGILCPFYKPGAPGGVETVIRTLLERLPERGILPSLVPFRTEPWLDFNNPALAPYLQVRSAVSALSRTVSGFDIIHSHHPFVTLPFALRKRTVMSVHVYSGDLHSSGPGFHPIRWASRNCIRMAECASGMAAREVTAVSEYLKGRLERESRISAKKISVVYNGLDTKAISKSIGDTPYRNGMINFACVGRVTRQKGFDSVLRALAEKGLEKAHLHIAGPCEDAGYADEMRGFAAKRGLGERFHMLGPISDAEKYALMHHADILVLPSSYEGLSIVAIEALASSSAILASDIPPHREVLGDAALYFKAGDARDLASKMVAALQDARQSRARRALASERAKSFSADAMVGGYVRAYERASG